MTHNLQQYLDAPIDTAERASKIWLPEGKAKPKRRDESELLAARANAQAGRLRHRQELDSKRAQLFDYYAGTAVPIERVAGHMGITDVKVVRAELAKRGRTA
jgi:hypothetical protein